jgi:hypothetical protein
VHYNSCRLTSNVCTRSHHARYCAPGDATTRARVARSAVSTGLSNHVS